MGGKVVGNGCMAAVNIPGHTHPQERFNSGSSSSGGHPQGAGDTAVTDLSPVQAAGPRPPSRRSPGATPFPLAAALSPGAGIRGRAPLGIGLAQCVLAAGSSVARAARREGLSGSPQSLARCGFLGDVAPPTARPPSGCPGSHGEPQRTGPGCAQGRAGLGIP